MHECVLSDKYLQAHNVHTLDVAKRLLDYGFYAPTIYFPLVVKGALMIEPTETESKETLDAFADAMLRIAQEAETDPALVCEAPHDTWVARLDETRGRPQARACAGSPRLKPAERFRKIDRRRGR
jgi:glycine dehydrogenase subunit 2